MNARVALLAFVSAALPAQALQVTAMESPPAGAVLLFATYDDQAKPPVQRWFLADFASGPPREFLRCEKNLSVVCRLDLRRLLVAYHGTPDGLYVLDLAKGMARLCEGAQEFVAVRGGDVLYLGHQRTNNHRLYACPWGTEGKPRALAEPLFEKVWLRDDAAIAVTSGDAPAIWAIDLLRGGGRKLLEIDGGREAGWTLEAAVAPSTRHFALGFPRGTLRVHEYATGQLAREWNGIPLHLSPISSSSPRLKVDFCDADTVIATESRNVGLPGSFVTVQRSIASGEVIRENPHSGNLEHEPPISRLPAVSELWGWPHGALEHEAYKRFEFRGDDLRVPGQERPIAVRNPKETTENGIEFTPDGNFAVVVRENGKYVLDVVDPGRKARRRLHEGFTTKRIWLPAL